jgi:hypothetical protein
MSKLPPYNITFTPSDGKNLTNTDIKNTIKNYDDYYVARYFFIQLETQDTHMNYTEIEIYDENGINIALTGVAIQSSTYTDNPSQAGDPNYAINGRNNNGPWQHTLNNVSTNYEWFGIDLKSSRKITGIRIYGRHSSHMYSEGGVNYARTAPFRIFLYKESEWKSSFENHTTGPGYGDNTDEYFHLHSDDAKKETRYIDTDNSQTVFYYGINALVPLNTTTKEYVNELDLYGNKSIINVTHENLPPYKITFEPKATRYHEARYFFIQLETENTTQQYAEIEIYDENGTNIALDASQNAIQSTTFTGGNNVSYPASNAFNNNTTGDFNHTQAASGEREWLGIDLGSNKKIADIRVYGRNGATYTATGPHTYTDPTGNTPYYRIAPFRIYLYKSDEYTGTFANYGTGPLDYTNYTLHTDDADVNETINDGKQQHFEFDLLQTKIRPTDISYAITNYDTNVGFKEAQYFFIQLETENKHMHYAEIEIYDENGNNVAFDASQNAIQSSTYTDSQPASNAFNNNNTAGDHNHTKAASGEREWLGINLGSNKKIAGIRVYGRGDNAAFAEGGYEYTRTAPFRIYLYTSDEYTGTFAAGRDNGPLDYDSYHLHSSNASYNSSTGSQQIFYFGIEASLTRKSSTITNHKAIARIVNSPQYNIKVYPSNSTEITVDDIKEANTNYQFAEKSVFFIQAETTGEWRIRELQILDPSGISYMTTTGNYSTPTVSSAVITSREASSEHGSSSHPVSKITDGTASSWISGSENIKHWVGIKFNSDKPIGIFRITGNKRRSFRVYLYTASEWGQRSLSDGPIDYDKYDLHSSDALLTLSDNSNSFDESDTYQYNFGINYIVPKNITTLPNLSTIYNLSSINIDNTLMTTGNYIGYSYPDGSKVEKFHPYNITIDNGTSLNKTARYVFIQLETENENLLFNEALIYNENNVNIAYNKPAVQSTTITNSYKTFHASEGVDGSISNDQQLWTNSEANKRSWWGVDLGFDQTIAGIRLYGYKWAPYNAGGSVYTRHIPHRIYLYTDTEYASYTFANGTDTPQGSGVIDYSDYDLHSDNVRISKKYDLSVTDNQEIFDYGSTPIVAADVSNAITNYDATVGFMQARYFFIENEAPSGDQKMTLGEIEIFDPSGNNVIPNNIGNIKVSEADYSDANGNIVFKDRVYDGNYNNGIHTGDRSYLREWIGIDLGSDKKIAGIRIYGRKGEFGIGTNTFRNFPFRVFLYRDGFYYDRFIDGTQGQSGSLDYGDYSLKSSDFTIVGYEKGTVAANTNEQDSDRYYAFYGIVQKLPKNVAPLYNNNALIQVKNSNYNLPPYKITVTPSTTRYHEARYFFIQLETEWRRMSYAEIKIYDENGSNIAYNLGTSKYVQSSQYSSISTYAASNVGDGSLLTYNRANSSSGVKEWLGIDLGSDKKILNIEVYGYYGATSPYYDSIFPFRIFLYSSAEYTGIFANGYDTTPLGTGPLDYDDYNLHSDDAVGRDDSSGSNHQHFEFDLLQTKITTSDIDRAIANYDTTVGFKLARYFYLQLETVETVMNYSEIEIYDENGTNIARVSGTAYAQSSSHVSGNYPASKAFDGNFTGSSYHHTKDDPVPNNTRAWIGVDFGSNKKIAGIRVFGRDGYTYDVGAGFLRGAPFRIFLYTDDEYTGTFADGGTGPLDYNTYHLRSSKDQFVNGPSNIDVTGSISDVGQFPYWYFGIELQIGNAKEEVHYVPSNIETYNKAIADVEYVNYSGHGNYYHMDVSMHYSDISYGVYLPTVTFTNSNGDGRFTNTMRIAQLSAQGFTGFYEADFANDITVIDDDAFLHDKKVCVVTINQVTDICGNAFKGCSNLRAVTLDTAVDSNHKYKLETIGTNAFEYCSALKQIFIPDSVTSIPNNAFKGCASLEVAVMGYGIPRNSVSGSIGANAFEDCTSLTYFYIPETVTSVGANAFNNCSSLESLYIDDSVSTIGTGAFTTISSSCIVYVKNDITAYPNDLFPTNAPIRRFTVVTINHTEYTLSNTNVNTACNNASISTTDYWKAKCTGSFSMFGTNVFNKDNISYDNLVSISIPSSSFGKLTTSALSIYPYFKGYIYHQILHGFTVIMIQLKTTKK